jgi:hypothetical protein
MKQQQQAVQQHTNTHIHTQHQCGELKRCNLFSSFHVQNLKLGCIFINEEEEEEDYYYYYH